MRQLLLVSILTVAVCVGSSAAQEPPVAVFKSGVEQVAVAAIVRDSRGRLITDLKPSDFELFDDGQRRQVTNVWSEPSPASVAILMDASGSMATKMARARETANTLVAGLKPGADEVAFYAFDMALREVRPFSTTFTTADGAWDGTAAYGATSLWDAIAETAQKISDRQRRRALVVITDGVDSASTMKPADVSAIASSLDVPVYMLVITFAADADGRDAQPMRGPMADLAAWTGGDSLAVRDTASALAATRQLLSELHHQYIVAFEPGSTRGWHAVVLRARKPGLFVRARSGYIVQ
jgi:Ca-activated chloride channel family protein